MNKMRAKSLICVALAGLSAVAIALDNPLPGFGMQYGDNFRRNITPAPYILGDGTGLAVKWSHDLSLPAHSMRRGAWNRIVFDAAGDLYIRSFVAGGLANSGRIVKLDDATGNVIWAGPFQDTAAGVANAPIIGTVPNGQGRLRLYAARLDAANPTVYALDQATGALIWESAPLQRMAMFNMALHNGRLYGLTQRTVRENRDGVGNYIPGHSYAFVIDAGTGAILHQTSIETFSQVDNGGNVAFVPNVFGPGEHGMYWSMGRGTGNNPIDSAAYGARINDTTAQLIWRFSPIHTNTSNVHYSAVTNTVYSVGWGDNGTTLVALSPTRPGDPMNELAVVPFWIASRNMPAGDPLMINDRFNAGFYPTSSVKVDGDGVILAGFDGWLYSVNDPGDLGGVHINSTHLDWQWDGSVGDLWRETAWLSTLVHDTANNIQAFVGGNWWGDRAYAHNAVTGLRLMEWVDPNAVRNHSNWRSVSVGPDGTFYYKNPNLGPQGTLFAIHRPPAATISGEIRFGGRVGNFPGTVNIEFRHPTTHALVHTAMGVALTAVADPEVRAYTIPAGSMPPVGSYMVSVFRVPYLRDAIGPVHTGTSLTGQDFSLLAGDVDGSNTVDLADFLILAATYEVSPPTDPNADLNGDGAVDLPDFLLLAANYDTAGDAP
jgi:hypothetical protein